MARPKKDPEQPVQYAFKISSSADCKKSLGRLMNLCANNKMDIANVRMCNEIIKTMITLEKNIEMEERLQYLEDLLARYESEE